MLKNATNKCSIQNSTLTIELIYALSDIIKLSYAMFKSCLA